MQSSFSAHTAILQDLQAELRQRQLSSVYVGYSGGVDSTVLLKLAVDCLGPDRVTAVHINHGLSDRAGQWQQQCADVAATQGCHFVALTGAVSPQGQGLEAAARALRYDLFRQHLPAGATLLLGHHLDDQVETFFLRLLRGSGIQGLQAMPKDSPREHYYIFRPLLDLPRSQIEALAEHAQLRWVEDESNEDTRFDRNFLRQSVLPLIESRWPAYRERIHSTIDLLSQPVAAEPDMAAALEHRLSHDGGLKLVQLDDYSEADLMSLLHRWLRAIGQQVPSRTRLQAIVREVVQARSDANPQVRLGAGDIRRHGPALYWVPDLPPPGPAPTLRLNIAADWAGIGTVSVQTASAAPALRADLPDLHWRLRQGGEEMRPHGRSKRRDLKRLLQEYRIKPWLRDRLPLLYSGDALVAVADELISAEHLAAPGEPGLQVFWRKV